MEPSDYKPFAPEAHDYVDGRLSAEAERDFERRMANKPELKSQVESLKRSIEVLRSLPVKEPRPGFDERVIGRIREEELAERARKQIVARPMPLWQHVVQVGLGAAAAVLVLAVIGMPGMFGDEAELSGSGGAPLAGVAPTEQDLLPALADHNSRFISLRRNLVNTRLVDSRLQRQFVALELEHSDLARRNQWLAAQVTELPAARRTHYQGYLAEIDRALGVISNEVNESQRGDRSPDMALITAQLGRVRTPGVTVDKYALNANLGNAVPLRETERMAKGELTEMMLYSLVRQADYAHDHAGVIEAAGFYLKHFSAGLFRDHANAAIIGAWLRLGREVAAARHFKEAFAEYDEDLAPGRLELVRGLLTDVEFEHLSAARKALR